MYILGNFVQFGEICTKFRKIPENFGWGYILTLNLKGLATPMMSSLTHSSHTAPSWLYVTHLFPRLRVCPGSQFYMDEVLRRCVCRWLQTLPTVCLRDSFTKKKKKGRTCLDRDRKSQLCWVKLYSLERQMYEKWPCFCFITISFKLTELFKKRNYFSAHLCRRASRAR